MLFEAKNPGLAGARKFARIGDTIVVAELPIGKSGTLQHVDIVKQDGLMEGLSAILRLPKEQRILQVDGGIVEVTHTSIDFATGTIQFSDSTSTLPIAGKQNDKELARAETLKIAAEQNPGFEVS